MRETIEIAAGELRAVIVPSLGAGVARFDLMRGRAREAIFRPWPDAGTDDPTQLASVVLVPWSNRISGGGFGFDGKFHALEPNLAGDPFPIHGNGWQLPWTVTDKHRARVVLELNSNGPGPYRYRAELEYTLDHNRFAMRLVVVNRGTIALPYGVGFHPWLPRTAATFLKAPAATVWLEDADHLPNGSTPVTLREDWDFSLPQTLPSAWINNGFAGWSRQATVEWRDRALALDIEASDGLNTYLLYSPGRGADFFCFEPVSHVVDAHNLPGGAAANGLVVLEPGETLSAACRFKPRNI